LKGKTGCEPVQTDGAKRGSPVAWKQAHSLFYLYFQPAFVINGVTSIKLSKLHSPAKKRFSKSIARVSAKLC
jgi:hypothetical protein